MGDKRGISGKALRGLDTTQGAPTFVMDVTTVSGTSSYTLVDAAEFPFRVLDAWAVKTGGAGGASDTFLLTNDGTAITDAVDMNIADKTLARVATIDDAYHKINRSSKLGVTTASGAVCTIYVLCART